MSNSQITPTDRMSQAGVLLTGSVPLYSTEEVIKYCGGGLGDVASGSPTARWATARCGSSIRPTGF